MDGLSCRAFGRGPNTVPSPQLPSPQADETYISHTPRQFFDAYSFYDLRRLTPSTPPGGVLGSYQEWPRPVEPVWLPAYLLRGLAKT